MIVAFDTETDLIQPGLLAPPLVCGSFAWDTESELLDADTTVFAIKQHLQNGSHIVGANIAYDMAVVAAHNPHLLPLIFQAYDEDRIHDVQIRQALNDIAEGHLYLEADGSPLKDPESGKITDRYSLATCLRLATGRILAKADTFRLKFATLRDIPIEEWPAEARDYAIGDAVSTLEVYLAQAKFRNLQDEPAQCRAAFALHLSAVWGIRTDPARVAAISEHVVAQFAADTKRFQLAGFIRADGSCDKKALSALVTAAYQGNPPMTAGGEKRGPTVSTSRDTLEESGDDLLMDYATVGENKTLHNTFLPTLEQGVVVPINPSIKTLVVSGRISYSRPNLTNLPR